MKMYFIQSPVHIQDEESPWGSHLIFTNIIILIYKKKLYLNVLDPFMVI